MIVSCWSAKGGAGTTVVAVAIALVRARLRPGEVLLVDLAGDAPAVLGMVEPPGPGLSDWLAAGPDVPADGLARLEVPGPGLSLLPVGTAALRGPERAEVLAAVLAGDGRSVVVDCGRIGGPAPPAPAAEVGRVLAGAAGESLLVTRPCFLSLRRAAESGVAPSGAVVVAEGGRALDSADVAEILGVPVRAEVPWDPGVARAVDAGVLSDRLPKALARSLRGLA